MIQLLVYGSLLNFESASFGLNRKVAVEDYCDIELNGFELAFDVLEDVLVQDESMKVCFLNLRKKEKNTICAKILRVDRRELDLLCEREKNYDLVDVSSHTLPSLPEIFTFIGKKEHLLLPGSKTVILQRYVEKVKNALPHFSESFAVQFEKQLEISTRKAGFVSGPYRFISNEQNRLAGY